MAGKGIHGTRCHEKAHPLETGFLGKKFAALSKSSWTP
jgi:hypothetical protein